MTQYNDFPICQSCSLLLWQPNTNGSTDGIYRIPLCQSGI